MPDAELRWTCTAPRWLNVPAFLKDGAWQLGLKISLEVDKGWIREHVRVHVWGNADKLQEFINRVEQASQEYNLK